jgi:hypothetical protein
MTPRDRHRPVGVLHKGAARILSVCSPFGTRRKTVFCAMVGGDLSREASIGESPLVVRVMRISIAVGLQLAYGAFSIGQ